MRGYSTRKQRQAPASSAGVPVSTSGQSDSVLFAAAPSQIYCFICNNSYWTTVNQTDAPQLSTTRILTFCDLFAINDEERDGMLRLACLNDPFCASCSSKMIQLQDWIAQLELLQKGIESLKADMSLLMVNSLPNSPNIEGTHHIKSKLVRLHSSARSKTSDAFQDLVRVAHFSALNDSVQVHPDLEIQQIVEEDGFFQTHSDDEYEEAVSSAEESNTTVAAKNPNRKHDKTKRQREPSVRIPQGEKIPAHPDGHCRLCPSKFKSQIQLSKHIRRTHSGISHPCRYCDKTFQDTSNRKRHEVSVHMNTTRDYVCDQCGKAYRTPWSLRDHVKQRHEGVILKQHRKIPSQCEQCGKVCSNLKNLRTHVRSNHTDRGIVCSICARPFKDSQRMRKHEKTHLSDWELNELEGITFPYKCTICPLEGQIGWKSKAALQIHFATEHPDEKSKSVVPTKPLKHGRKYFCEVCPGRPGFTRRLGLEGHIRSGHAATRLLSYKFGKECQICKKPCRDVTKAILHQGTHYPRHHVCNHCLFFASKRRAIESHYKTEHPGATIPKFKSFFSAKKYFCPECPPDHPGFAKEDNMRLHMKVRHSKRYKGDLENYDSGEEEISDNKAKPLLSESDDESDAEEQISEDEESSEEDTKPVSKKRKIALPQFSRKGRQIQPTRKFQQRPKAASVESEKKLTIRIERVDSRWPRGRVRRVKTIRSGSSEDEDDTKPGTENELSKENEIQLPLDTLFPSISILEDLKTEPECEVMEETPDSSPILEYVAS